ncbi:DNA (cytosine-5-)-methyltransferase [Pseudomonas sp. SP16.1]|uniref:DNA (cytosine-5-)-methyltransferase n=1 Tax=Pseudomonas sp. SP16.1 TaxID=3458854 RepID=UPI004046133A
MLEDNFFNLGDGLGGIRSLRTQAKIKLEDLANSARVSLNTLKKIERGLGGISPDVATRLGAALGVSDSLVQSVHKAFLETATPGEGYVTSKAGNVDVTYPAQPLERNEVRRRVLDIFCGAGGLSYGFEQTGRFVTVGGIDLLQDRIDTFTANHKHAVGIAGDIRKIDPETIEELIGGVDVLAGGPPCQGFSSIRPFRNLTESDPRNNLVEHYVLILSHLKPRWFVFENVVGLLTHEKGGKLEAILEAFSEIGYKTSWRVMNAASYGVPQSRERIVIVGNRIGKDFLWPKPSHHYEYRSMAGRRHETIHTKMDLFSQEELRPAVTLMDAIGDLPPVESGQEATSYSSSEPKTEYQSFIRGGALKLTWHRATKHSPKMLEIIKHAGSSIHDLPPGMVTSGFSSCYSRLDADRPSNTITVNFVHPSSNRCIHPFQNRALTPREGARIQSFPDSFEFKGSAAQIVKQIGNAVPPLLGAVIARSIAEQDEA